MLKNLEFKLLFLALILLPILKGTLRTVLFGIVIIIGTHFMAMDLKDNKLKLSLRKEDIQGRMLIASIILMGYSCINIVLNGFSYSVLERIIQLYACLVVLLTSSVYSLNEKDYRFCINIIRISILVNIIIYPIIGTSQSKFCGIFSSSNSLGGVIFCYLGIYLLISRKYSAIDKFIIMLSIILMYLSDSRASIIALILFIVFKYIFTRQKIKRKKFIFYILVIIFTLFPILYISLYNSEFRSILNELSIKYFNKNFFSGRQVLWEPIIKAIEAKPLFGYGLDVVPEMMLGINKSSHSWYMQILLQMGIIGYFFTINIINIIWKTLDSREGSNTSLSTCAFIIGMLVWQCFEVTITQNNIQIGILVWLVMGLGINENLNSINVKKNDRKKEKRHSIR